MRPIEEKILEAQELIQTELKALTGREIDPHDGTAQLRMVRSEDVPRRWQPPREPKNEITADLELTLRARELYGRFVALDDLAIDLDLPRWRS